MIKVTDIAGGVAVDPRNLNGLRQSAKNDNPEAVKATAKQMEGVFVEMMLKSMRKATPQEGPLDNDQSRLFTAMLDTQISQKANIGLADMMIKQLSKQGGQLAAAAPNPSSTARTASAYSAASAYAAAGASTGTAGAEPAPRLSKAERIQGFLSRLSPYAEQASRATGIPAQFMLSHAALESGWGKREIPASGGVPSHNLFGIKAGKSWSGRTVDCLTTEYVDGVPQKVVQKFRAYDSYTEAFQDYANVLQSNPRYQGVVAKASDPEAFAYGLQRAGYATDPRYGAKLSRIIEQTNLVQASIGDEVKIF